MPEAMRPECHAKGSLGLTLDHVADVVGAQRLTVFVHPEPIMVPAREQLGSLDFNVAVDGGSKLGWGYRIQSNGMF